MKRKHETPVTPTPIPTLTVADATPNTSFKVNTVNQSIVTMKNVHNIFREGIMLLSPELQLQAIAYQRTLLKEMQESIQTPQATPVSVEYPLEDVENEIIPPAFSLNNDFFESEPVENPAPVIPDNPEPVISDNIEITEPVAKRPRIESESEPKEPMPDSKKPNPTKRVYKNETLVMREVTQAINKKAKPQIRDEFEDIRVECKQKHVRVTIFDPDKDGSRKMSILTTIKLKPVASNAEAMNQNGLFAHAQRPQDDQEKVQNNATYSK